MPEPPTDESQARLDAILAEIHDIRQMVRRVLGEPGLCVECGSEQGEGRGWRMYLTVDDETALYCPYCARDEGR